MEYYRSVRGNSAPYSKALHAINHMHRTWKTKNGTALTQAEQQACSSQLQLLSSPLH